MAEEQTTTPAGVTQGNEPAIRTPTGEIKDQQAAETKPDTSTATSTESKAEEKSLLNKDDKKEEPKAAVPDKYEPFKVPEGHELDEKFATEAGAKFKELGLTQDQAQSLVDMYNKKALEQGEAPYKAYEEMRNGWRKDVVSDPKLGDGSNLKPEVKASIGRMWDSTGDPKLVADFKAAMDMTGAGDNPAFVRMWAKVSEMYGEGTGVRGSGPSKFGQTSPGAAPKSAAAALYPNLPSSSNG